MIYTNDTMTENELREFFEYEPDEDISDIIAVCDGQWKKEGPDLWRFWRWADA